VRRHWAPKLRGEGRLTVYMFKNRAKVTETILELGAETARAGPAVIFCLPYT